MRILHLAWEYPPVMFGGLGRHVHALAGAQAANGHDVVVITQAPDGDLPSRDDRGVRVIRTGGVPALHDGGDLLGHVAQMEWAFTASGEELLTMWTPEVIHAHDWMVSHAGSALRQSSGAPLVATIHATEAGRHRGWIRTEVSTAIHGVEWWLANTADSVITCSAAMDREVRHLFSIGPTTVVANGIDRSDWQPMNGAAARMRKTHAGTGPLLAYTGRVEWEKGVQTVLAAMPILTERHAGLRLLVAGRGSYLPALQEQAHDLGVDHATRFLGWVSEEDLRGAVAAADLALAPSLYEPFGLVALEAAALGTPVVVADTGGLSEFAAHGQRASTFRPGDPDSLADAVTAALQDPAATRARTERASAALAVHYDWRVIAEQTVQVYRLAQESLGTDPFDPRRDDAARRHMLDQPRHSEPPGRLLDMGW